jgi:hypothetical protein
LIYVDDIFVVSHDPKNVMDMLSEHYTVKKGSVTAPTEYRGAEIKTYQPDKLDSRVCWAMSWDLYVKHAVKEVQRNLAKANEKPLPNKTVTPLTAGYRPKLDATPELDDAKANYFQGLTGVLRWMIELGRIDIMVSIAMLSHYLANPREGHLSEAIYVFAYLKAHDRSSLVLTIKICLLMKVVSQWRLVSILSGCTGGNSAECF